MTDVPAIRRIHHAQITIPTGKEDAACAFYCGVLGLKEVPKPPSLAGRGGFWLELGDVQVHIGTENESQRPSSKAHIAYEVIDLERWRVSLKNAGITAEDDIPIPNYRRFEFRDPFGNRVEFLERNV